VCDCLKSEQPPSASAHGRGELAKQPREYLANIKASGCAALRAHQRPRGRFKTACTSPPPTKSVHVDFKHACARNPPASAQQNMHSTRRPILWALGDLWLQVRFSGAARGSRAAVFRGCSGQQSREKCTLRLSRHGPRSPVHQTAQRVRAPRTFCPCSTPSAVSTGRGYRGCFNFSKKRRPWVYPILRYNADLGSIQTGPRGTGQVA
jgi:hypothetical protein